tara:strand:+ start:2109 stop:3242 length:1134 start_codon:yes stop_codon:yes gene_type:complete
MKKIAIIGAGISGLFLANLLERDKNYSYKIFEKKSLLDTGDGYGIQLSVNSINLLNKIGFQKINLNDIYFPKKVNFFNAKKLQKICDIDLAQFNYDNNRYTTLKRSELVKFLLNNIPKEKIILNSDLENIEIQDQISLTFKNQKISNFDYLVAADGIYSRTRQILFKNQGLPIYFNAVAIRGKIENFENFDISLYLGPNFHFVIYPINQKNEFNFILIIRKKLSENQTSNKKFFNDGKFINNLLNQASLQTNLNLNGLVKGIKCFPIFVSKKIQVPKFKNIFFIGDAFYSFPPSFAQGASQSLEAANELYKDLKNNSSNYHKIRILKTKQINFRSFLNHFAFHLSNPLNIFIRNMILKYLTKNKKFLEKYLGKIYKI